MLSVVSIIGDTEKNRGYVMQYQYYCVFPCIILVITT